MSGTLDDVNFCKLPITNKEVFRFSVWKYPLTTGNRLYMFHMGRLARLLLPVWRPRAKMGNSLDIPRCRQTRVSQNHIVL